MFCDYLKVGAAFVVLINLINNGQAICYGESHFNRHKVVTPVLHHAKTKTVITSTMDLNGLHYLEVTMTIDIDGQEQVLDLRLNTDLLAADHELDICQYSGTVRGRKSSWAALSTCHGVRGIIHDGEQTRYIEPVVEKDQREQMQKMNEMNRTKALRRDKRGTSIAEKNKQKGPLNSDQFSRYIELVLVADNSLFKTFGENITNVHSYLKTIANIINSLYAPLNVFVPLVGVVVWNEGDEIQMQAEVDTVYSNFLRYREGKLLLAIPNDNAQLVTSTEFKNGLLERSFVGSICTSSFSGGVNSDYTRSNVLALTIAHAIAHNLGMHHDSEDCFCPEERCIMSTTFSSKVQTHWSSCSFFDLASSFEKGMDYCLRNKPTLLFESPTCGNGFVESNEECDCGAIVTEQCARCCNTKTCMMWSNATCAVGECCDPWTCQRKERGTICRTAVNECDLPEYCDGYSEDCPENVYKMDTTPCSNDTAYCVKGSCSSHTDRCQLLWGPTGKMSDAICYEFNMKKDTFNGHCDYQTIGPFKRKYLPCLPRDRLCGVLHCDHRNDKLEFGMEMAAIVRSKDIYTKKNSISIKSKCISAIIDMGMSDVDPGMVPDGAKCGHEKMCLKHKCVSIASVRENIAKLENSVCPSNCSGHGVCNSKGHCHCEPGFIPPTCQPVFSGSIDSGPVLLLLQPQDNV